MKTNGVGETLLVVFVVLKLTGNIDWSWWWVLCPLWIPLLIALLALGVGCLAMIIAGFRAQHANKKALRELRQKLKSINPIVESLNKIPAGQKVETEVHQRKYLHAILLALTIWAQQAQAQPNILVIQADDQSYAQDQIAMPFLWDKYGTEGMVFANYYVTTPQCCPSRVSLLTGQYRRTHGVLSNNHKPPLTLDTLPKRLQALGYYTAHIGKYTNAQDGTPRPEYNYWAAPVGGKTRDRQENVLWNVNGVEIQHTGLELDTILEHVAEVIDECPGNRPLALFINPHAPHAKALAYPEDKGYFSGIKLFTKPSDREADLSDKPRYVREFKKRPGAIRKARVFYKEQLDASSSIDRMIFNTHNQLELDGRAQNAVVFYTSDNGYLYGEHGIVGKSVPYEEAIKVPAIMWGAGVPEGLDLELRANIDVAPTLLRLAGGTAPATMEGQDMYRQGHKVLFIEGGGRALTEKGNIPKWVAAKTLNRVAIETAGEARGECYNMKTDPWQMEAKPLDSCPKLQRAITQFKRGKAK